MIDDVVVVDDNDFVVDDTLYGLRIVLVAVRFAAEGMLLLVLAVMALVVGGSIWLGS